MLNCLGENNIPRVSVWITITYGKEDILLVDTCHGVADVHSLVRDLLGNDEHACWLARSQDHLQGGGYLEEAACDCCQECYFHFDLIN